jgi:cellulose 1,4-beta-cellobiosidase
MKTTPIDRTPSGRAGWGRHRVVTAAGALALLLAGSPAGAAGAAGAESAAGVAAAKGAAVGRVDNPYAGARVYVNPAWAARAAAEPGGAAVADQPTAVWLDRIAAIDGAGGDLSLRDHLDEALAQDADVIQLTLYNLPGRDCDRLFTYGDLAVGELDRYKTEFIDPIAEVLADPAYAGLRIVAIIEPRSLPYLISHTGERAAATEGCNQVKASGDYVFGVGYAVARLAAIDNVYPYLDLSHHGHLGWPDEATPALDLYPLAVTSAGASLTDVHGFAVNTANYSVLREEYFTADDVVNGQHVRQSKWVDWNPFVAELSYATAFREELIGRGFDAGIGMVVDTSRNGWGGPDRPTGPGPLTSVDAYVDGSRLDRRADIDNWCNQRDAGLGERPTAAPAPGIDAYAWIKPPGESDGSSRLTIPERRYEPMCAPNPSPERANPPNTGALGDAPLPGEWFSEHFQILLRNAWPPVTG